MEIVIYECDFGEWFLRILLINKGSCCYWLFLDISFNWESWIFVLLNSFVLGKWWNCLSDDDCKKINVKVVVKVVFVDVFENFNI